MPGYRLVNRCREDRYEIEKTIITDPERSVLVQRIRFRTLVGVPTDYRVFALLAPHIGNQGYGNDGWVDSYKGISMLFARRADVSLAVMCDAGWRAARGRFVVSLDADLQNDPADIPMLLDKLDEMPKPKELAARGEPWGPYRTLAGLYLWRIADFQAESKPVPAANSKPKRSQD